MRTPDKSSPDQKKPAAGDESPAQKAQRLLAEARGAALEHTRTVDQALRQVVDHASQIAEGGDVYPASVRDLCARLAEEAEARRELLNQLALRSLNTGPVRRDTP